MKTKIYIRAAKMPNGRVKVDARSTRPNYAPLVDGRGDGYPTVAFGLEVEIPDVMFKQAEQIIARIQIPEEAIKHAMQAEVEVLVP